ncbi:acetate--CoA ligase family protein [Marinovum sp.]|uniref:acetate--CoA ligase family protein n=1 Tax=Marinovum sp. TaxID=2024839 RepID=UPI003A8D0B99
MSAGLERLLRPQTIAVIGGGSWCENVIGQCQRIGFEGAIWPVHPTRAALGGLACFADVAALPGAPDAAFVGVNRDASLDVVRALAARGAGGAVCFASGFGETGDGGERQAALVAAAGEMTILGPNCYGFLNYLDGAALWPDQHGGVPVERGVALVTQSSNIAINLTMQARGLPVAYVVTVGNQAQTGLSEVARALLADPRVTALGLHIEGIDDLRGLEALAAEARARGIPVVALKVGRSAQAQAATISHTASLAGSDAGARALLARLGIGQVESLPVLLETLKLLHVTGPLESNRIASLSCSGGEASLMADMAEGAGVEFPPLAPAQERALRAVLGPRVTLANPLDYHTYIWGDVAAMAATFSAMMQADVALGCVVLDLPRADRCDPEAWEPAIQALEAASAACGKTLALVSSLPETLHEALALRLTEAGIPAFGGMAEALAAISVVAGMRAREQAPLLLPPPAGHGRTLSEAEAKAVLAAEGISVPRSATAATPEAAAEAAEALGFPVVLKGCGIAHKTEAGAVVLGLGTPEAVASAARAMPTDSFLVEQQITGTVAELLIGVVADPAHGYVLTLAAGGTLTELLADRASLLIPADRDSLRAALMGLRIAALLKGYRGQPAADVEAVLDVAMAVQAIVARTLPQEIEINPLLCTPHGAVAADALIRTGDPT